MSNIKVSSAGSQTPKPTVLWVVAGLAAAVGLLVRCFVVDDDDALSLEGVPIAAAALALALATDRILLVLSGPAPANDEQAAQIAAYEELRPMLPLVISAATFGYMLTHLGIQGLCYLGGFMVCLAVLYFEIRRRSRRYLKQPRQDSAREGH